MEKLSYVIVFLLVLVMSMPVSAATVLHYDFEDGTPETPMSDPGTIGQVGTVDLSGNGYDMFSYDDWWGPIFSSLGETATGVGLSSEYDGHRDGYTQADGLRAWSPSTWTIELSFRLDHLTGWLTLIGRDDWTGIDGDIGPSLQVQCNDIDDAMRVAFATVSDEHYEIFSSLVPVPGQWYHLAVVTDGDQLDMYADQLDGNGYQNIGTLNMVPGADHSLRPTGNWTFGRGWYNGGFVDHISGNMDDIRFSDVALSPHEFLHQPRAYDPDPADNAPNVSSSQATLSWTNPDSVGVCEVYFAKNVGEPNYLDYKDVLALIETVNDPPKETSVSIPTALAEGDVCYWLVDSYSGRTPPEEPNLPGLIWKFTVNDNDKPVVFAGDDQGVWFGKDGADPNKVNVILGGLVTDDGLPNPPAAVTVQWTQILGPGTVIEASDMQSASTTLTETGTYQFNLWATDDEFTDDDTVVIYVGEDSCKASHMMPGSPDYAIADFNQNCIVNLGDAAQVALLWLDCTDLLTNCN